MKTLQRLRNSLYFIILLCMIMPLIAHAYIGTFSRLTADDYGSAIAIRGQGISGYTIGTYNGWSGRYSATTLDGISASFGSGITAYSTAITLLVWFVVSFLTFAQISLSNDKKKRYGSAALLSALIIFTTLGITPDIKQSLYWMQGMHSLIPSCIFSTALLGVYLHIIKNEHQKKWKLYSEYTICFVIPLISGGFSETFVTLQCVALIITLLITLIFWKGKHRRQALLIFTISLLGAIAALALVSFAPGNAVRSGGHTAGFTIPAILETLKISFIATRDFYSLLLSFPSRVGYSIGLFIVSVILGMLYANNTEHLNASSTFKKTFLFLFPFISLIFLIIVCFFPGAFAVARSIPRRTMLIPAFVVVVSVAAWGFVFGMVHLKGMLGEHPEQNKVGKLLIITILCAVALLPVYNCMKILSTNSQIMTFATQWDQMNSQIIQAKKNGETEIVVLPLEDWAGLDGITSNPKDWVNVYASIYYGLQVTSR